MSVMSTRRIFLRNSALAMVGMGSAPMWLTRALYAKDEAATRKKVLVAIFQRGAADGLNVIVPHGEKAYYGLRPTIAVPRPSTSGDRQQDAAIDLDGFFGLHPSLAPLKPLFDRQHLAIVDAVGSPDPTRSHFDAQDYMESGTPGLKATDSGWMNRALPKAEGKVSPVRAVALGATLPRTLRGGEPAISLQSIGNFQVRNAAAAKQFQEMYATSTDPRLQVHGPGDIRSGGHAASHSRQPYTPAHGAELSARALRGQPAADCPIDQVATWAWRWRLPTSAAGIITSTNWGSAHRRGSLRCCCGNTARR